MTDFGKVIIGIGIILIVFGVILVLSPKVPLLGKLPGDIFISKNGFTFYFPLATSLLVSIIVSAVLYFLRK